uniref:glycylpeptide N-tetradecanoyltransferase n=1 Tax=Heterorhabditis bacteriophora TaxID=37862 RepID=A0A1I7WPB0_HETBA
MADKEHSHSDGKKCCNHSHKGLVHLHGEGSSGSDNGSDMQSVMKLAEQLKKAGLDMPLPQLSGSSRYLQDTKIKNFAFWSTQPVPQFGETDINSENTFIEADLPTDKIRQESYSLPDSFIWSDINVDDDAQLQVCYFFLCQSELYTLLTENYVEDDDNMFRFDYSAAFLKWFGRYKCLAGYLSGIVEYEPNKVVAC